MTEEKKENKPAEAPKAEAPKEAPKVETPKAEEPKAEAPKAETAAVKPEEAKKAEEKKKEKPANCAACNKSIKKKCYYYRNGKHFCSKRCWKTTVKKEEKAPEAQNPPDAKENPPSK